MHACHRFQCSFSSLARMWYGKQADFFISQERNLKLLQQCCCKGVQGFQIFTHSSCAVSNLIASLLEGGRFQAIFQYVKTQAIHRPTLIIMVCKYAHTICHMLSFGVIEYKLCMQAYLLCFASEGSAVYVTATQELPKDFLS